MQTDGWKQGTVFASEKLEELKDVVYDEPTTYAGTMGRSLRMEALKVNMKISTVEPKAVVKIRAHVQGNGWDKEYTKVDTTGEETAVIGTTGSSLRMEAVQISATGLTTYRILYRAHVQGEGWQGWVDAEDSEAFAGTTGRSKRIEALEIAIVSRSSYTYKTSDTTVGKHTVSYNGTVMGIEDCTYGDWTYAGSASNLTFTRHCTLCDGTDTKKSSLSEIIKEDVKNDDGVVTVNGVTIAKTDKLTIPSDCRLVVNGKLNVQGKLAIDGDVVVKDLVVGSNATVQNNGTFTIDNKFKDSGKLSSFLGEDYSFVNNIIMEKGSVQQEVESTLNVTNKNLTLDLNGTTVNSTAIGYIIDNTANLTINNGKFISDNNKGIETVGNLTINGGSIKADEEAVRLGTPINGIVDKKIKDYSDVKVTLDKVRVETTGTSKYALVAVGNNANIALTDCTVVSASAALGTNNRTSGAGFTVNGGRIESKAGLLAYLPADGNNTFSGVTLVAEGAGIEVASGKLTLSDGAKLVVRGEEGTYTALNSGKPDGGGYGILVKVKKGYGKKAGSLNINVDESTITSAKDYALAIVENSGAESEMSSVKVSITGSTIKGGKVDDSNERLPILTSVLDVDHVASKKAEDVVNVSIDYQK